MKLALGDYIKLLFAEGDVSSAGNEQFFGCWPGFLLHPQGFLERFDESGEEVNTWWGQQSKIKKGGIFS